MYKVFVINLGSTSTKVGLYEESRQVFAHTVSRASNELEQFSDFQEQLEYRIDIISKIVKELGHSLEGVYRQSRVHALNQKETAIQYAEEIGKSYEDLNLIVAHIGGGISITAHKKGKNDRFYRLR